MFRRKAPPHPWALTSPLLDLAGVPWTVDDATMGTHIFGAVGSGKTSSSGNAIAQAFLLHQFGGLVLCAKADEAQRWRAYAEQAGRSQDVRVVQAGGPYRFNFLDHELAVGGSLVQLLTDTLELTEGRQSLDSNPFWARATAELVRNTTPLFGLAGEPLSLIGLMDLIRDAPKSLDQERSREWARESYCAQLFRRAKAGLEAIEDAQTRRRYEQDYRMASNYWLRRFPTDDAETRSNILATFTGNIDQLLHGIAWELLATDTTITPEETLQGRIIVLDLPTTRPGDGRIIQLIWKHAFQKAVLRRRLGGTLRPVFLFVDEAQEFVSPFDALYQSECRQYAGCTVYLSQNISAYQTRLHGHDAADALLANFRTLIFHANRGPTNQWAADAIAQTLQPIASYQYNQREQRGINSAMQMHYQVPPATFTRLGFGETIVTTPRGFGHDTFAQVSFA